MTGAGQGSGSSAESAPALSVVVPVKDEAGNLLPLIEEIHAALDGVVDFEIVYVDDGSGDSTQNELSAAWRRFPRLNVVRHRVACGQSTALLSGVQAARGDWIATLDGDGQNPPADILKLIKARDATGDPRVTLVAGERAERRDSIVRRLSSRLANGLRSRVLKDGVRDTGCGLKLIRRDAYLSMPAFDHMHRFLPALAQARGGRVIVVAVGHRPRGFGRTKYGVGNRLWVGLVDLFGVLWLKRRSKVPDVEQWKR
ncbi:MAG: glycosyltransferase [Alphaproteobacteria bacterium]|nr:glycosyltransferase [Alphaproteobacteria bacterium]